MRRLGMCHLVDASADLHAGSVVCSECSVFAQQRRVLRVPRTFGLLMVVALEGFLLLKDSVVEEDPLVAILIARTLHLLQLLEEHLRIANVASAVGNFLLQLLTVLGNAERAAKLIAAHEISREESLLLLLLLVAVRQAVLERIAIGNPCMLLLEKDVWRVPDFRRVGLELFALIARAIAYRSHCIHTERERTHTERTHECPKIDDDVVSR